MPNLILKEVVLNINVICNCPKCNCLQTGLCFSAIIQNSVPSPFNSLQRSTPASHWPLLFLAPFLRPKCVEDFPFHFVYTEESNFIIAEVPEGLSLSYPTSHVIHRPEKLKENINFRYVFQFRCFKRSLVHLAGHSTVALLWFVCVPSDERFECY